MRLPGAAKRVNPMPEPQTIYPVGRGFASGYLDNLQIDGAGLLRLRGWCREIVALERFPAITVDGTSARLLQHFRFSRPDVPLTPQSTVAQSGIGWDFLIADYAAKEVHRVELEIPGDSLVFETTIQFRYPDYGPLFDEWNVHGREHIYGSGPPNKVVHPDVLQLARRLAGPVLDFGCGQGILIGELLNAGIEAQGIELDSPVIRAAIPGELSSRITLYDGTFPTSFADGTFRSVICSEVLEHIPDYRTAVAEIARLATEAAVFTVPDAAAIPIGHRHGVVPWHLMESTHVNFFNQRSLAALLEPHFSRIEFGRAGLAVVNDSFFYVSLTATCYK